ncbi:hypothetical protein [Stackebrandtia nassauensis]|uniref:Uncharacterized protein n=1 Tax=Stackebrandtia nassauensis (strain DSM 44728 / CIP 108903 / NRRL B-16338 / NBRC 102104 / LLR-40K-21) TaxID=446470 RepID=D3Q2X4_STANL|nr:hypothetical protein [Stackebrandtia nassauensis]ADD45875.1 hypothetical protein Snas_6255 [Stackebrandtia nassauensis DSM 44728]
MSQIKPGWTPFGPSSDSGNTATEGKSALRTPHSAETPTETFKAGQRADARARIPEESAPKSAHTDNADDSNDLSFKEAVGQWLAGVGARVKPIAEGLRPPSVWTEAPASLAALVRYADTAPWADKAGPIRTMGKLWCRVISVPVSVIAYYIAWLTQRPSRFITAVIVYAVIAHTSIGSWLPWLWETT